MSFKFLDASVQEAPRGMFSIGVVYGRETGVEGRDRWERYAVSTGRQPRCMATGGHAYERELPPDLIPPKCATRRNLAPRYDAATA